MEGNFVDLTNEEEDPGLIIIKVHGKPQALPRSRFAKKGLYNPKRAELAVFKEHVKEQVPRCREGPIYEQNIMVCMNIKCALKRPNSDFKGGTRHHSKLKSTAPSAAPIIPDIDNLAKFVLDGLKGLIYKDDCQVVILNITKVRDNEGECNGQTEIIISQFRS